MKLESSVKRHKPKPTSAPQNDAVIQTQTPEDRLGNLTDSLLSHILSKLPTKLAVGTAALSTRWTHLLSQIPNLKIDIDDAQILNPDTQVQCCVDSFTWFVYHLLNVTLRNVPRVQKCVLHLKQDYEDCHVNAWISAFVNLNVSELQVVFRGGHRGLSSDHVFRSESLASLMLSHHNFLDVSGSCLLPNLKSLILMNVRFFRADLMERVISACPVLDSLSISHCRIQEVIGGVLRIEWPSVKKLTLMMISDCCSKGMYDLLIDTPALELLHYVDHLRQGYRVKHLGCDCEAYTDIGPSREQCEEDETQDMWHKLQNVRDLVEACSSVRSLFLPSITMVALSCSPHPLPTFHNLRELKLRRICTTGWELLPQFLDSAPNLEVLVFKGGISQCEGCYAKFRSKVPEHVPKCLTSNLHTIKFEAFKGEEDELDLAEYFLNCTQLLGQMKFRFSCTLISSSISCTKSKMWSLRNLAKKSEVDFSF